MSKRAKTINIDKVITNTNNIESFDSLSSFFGFLKLRRKTAIKTTKKIFAKSIIKYPFL